VIFSVGEVRHEYSGGLTLPHKIVRFSLILAGAVSLALAQGKPIPQLVKSGGKFTMLVDGKPFIIWAGKCIIPMRIPT
jgi:hypothetical protein